MKRTSIDDQLVSCLENDPGILASVKKAREEVNSGDFVRLEDLHSVVSEAPAPYAARKRAQKTRR